MTFNVIKSFSLSISWYKEQFDFMDSTSLEEEDYWSSGSAIEISFDDEKLYSDDFLLSDFGVPMNDFSSDEELELDEELSFELLSLSDPLDDEELEFDRDGLLVSYFSFKSANCLLLG